MSRRLLPVLLALLAWAASACQVTIAAGIDLGRDGSGRVSAGVGLDDAALKELGDMTAALRVFDLRQAGWQVDGPRKEDDGLTWVRASKPFADAEEAAAVAAELNGPTGPFREFRVVREESLFRSRSTFTGLLDLSAGLAGLSDPELTTALGDVDPGLDLDGLRRRFGDDLARSVKVQVTAGLPGDVTTNATGRDGDRARWAPALGETVRIQATSEALRIDPVVPVAGGALLAVAVAVVVMARRRAGRR